MIEYELSVSGCFIGYIAQSNMRATTFQFFARIFFVNRVKIVVNFID